MSRYYQKAQALSAIPEGTIIGPVLEVHIVNILDGYGIEVAIPSISSPTYTSQVVISRETERFVNEFHDHKEELRSSNKLLAELQGSGRCESYEERKGSSSTKETCASPFSNPPQRASMYTQRTILTNERKWKVIHAHSPDGGYLATAVSKMVTKILRHCDQEESQTDGSRRWDTIRPRFVRAFAREEARDFDDGYWLMLFHEGSNKMRIEYCKFTSYSGTLWCCSNKSRIDELHVYAIQMEGVHLSHRNFVKFSIHFGEWNNSWRKRE